MQFTITANCSGPTVYGLKVMIESQSASTHLFSTASTKLKH